MAKKNGSKVHTQSLEEDAAAEVVEDEEQLEIVFDKTDAIELLEKSRNEDFPVCLNDEYEALGYTTIGNAKRLLTNNGFFVGEDYVTERDSESKGKSGRPNTLYFLTIDCFKHLGMLAQTKEGRAIRSYFIAAEKELRRREKEAAKEKGEAFYLPEDDQSDAAMLVRLIHQSYLAKVALREQQQQLKALEGQVKEVNSELDRYRDGHGYYFSCVGWCNIHSYKKTEVKWLSAKGKEASKICKSEGIKREKTNDPRFGEIYVYPISVLVRMDWPFEVQQRYIDIVEDMDQ